jgi:hypothetical protein
MFRPRAEILHCSILQLFDGLELVELAFDPVRRLVAGWATHQAV